MMEPISNQDNRLEQLSQSVARMPSLSVTMMKVLEICNSPEASPDDLNRVISLDPVLAGKVLLNLSRHLCARMRSLTNELAAALSG